MSSPAATCLASRQIKRLEGGRDVLVATPGRPIDLIERRALTLRDVEALVLDEADQMLDLGFIHALRRIKRRRRRRGPRTAPMRQAVDRLHA